MPELSRTEIDTLLSHMVRCEEVFIQASTRIKPECFDDSLELPHKLVWRATLEFYKETNKLPHVQYLFDKISSYVVGVPMLTDPNIYASVQWMASNIFSQLPDKELIPSYGLKLLDRFNFDRNMRRNIYTVMEGEDVTTTDIQRELDKHQGLTAVRVIEPFGQKEAAVLKIAPRDRTGVQFMDTLLGGGVRPCEVYGFIAPSGGGKTTISNQIAINYAKRQRHVAVFSYEEPVTPEYLLPVYACSAHIDRDTLERVGDLSKLPPDLFERYKKADEEIGRYLHYVDFSGTLDGRGRGGPAEMAAAIKQFANQGIIIQAFVVDWFLPMAQRWMSRASRDTSQRFEWRTQAQEVLDGIKQTANQTKCWGWVNHQLAPSEANKRGKHEQQAAAELKSFSWYLNGCFTLNALRQENGFVGDINFSKARATRKGSCQIRLDGAYATFEPVGDDERYDPNQRKVVKKVDMNAVPRENTPKARGGLDDNYSAVRM